MKKTMNPPKTLNGVEHVFRALPLLFRTSTMPPKKLGLSSEALFHVLETSEDPDGFLHQRPLSCPVVIVSESNCMIAIGNMPVTTFNTERLNEGLLYLMAYYYALHLTYPKCISTLLSVLQTEVLQDSIHHQDMSPSYKKAIGEWKSFKSVSSEMIYEHKRNGSLKKSTVYQYHRGPCFHGPDQEVNGFPLELISPNNNEIYHVKVNLLE
ncbi:uncharacterized protein V6R79_024334 [Siganus canaliculatus]